MFPTLIAILTMFFVGGAAGFAASALSALMLTGLIVLCVFMTLLSSRVLSTTVLKGVPSSFTMELPPYRKPQIGKIVVRSLCDRTLFVLGRAACVAAPAGVLLWLLANLSIGEVTLLARFTAFLDPLARLMGMDGVLLAAFILGFPANEIVLPVALMAYLSAGSLVGYESLPDLKRLLVDQGWTWITAVSVMLFSLMHWPCSTTLATIYKESQSKKWTLIALLLPTVAGMTFCIAFTALAKWISALL